MSFVQSFYLRVQDKCPGVFTHCHRYMRGECSACTKQYEAVMLDLRAMQIQREQSKLQTGLGFDSSLVFPRTHEWIDLGPKLPS